jgi:para-nitrobenzyl esterase
MMTTATVTHQIAPTVQTTRGAVRGTWESGIAVFRGIPYAEPPVGKLRFKPPVVRARWDGVRDATHFGEIAPQTDESPLDVMALPAGVAQGDDCLNLNVWTPELGSTELPVLVWIHGGGFRFGAGSCPGYDGRTFARDGVVTVTLNYRLGVCGFLYIGERPGSGNFGLLDQIAALEWVQENIAAFGGDPNRVTVAGESAGAQSIGELLAVPPAHGLFRRGIMMSGSGQSHMRAEAAAVTGETLLGQLGARFGDDDALAALTTPELLAAQRAVDRETLALLAQRGVAPDPFTLAFGVSFFPTTETDLLPKQGLVSIANGAARDVDLLVGTNADEWAVFVPTRALAIAALKRTAELSDVMFKGTGQTGAEALESYRRCRPGACEPDVVVPFMTDAIFRIPAIRLAETAQQHNPRTYMFQFAWKGSFGAVHVLGVPFMFDTLDKSRSIATALGAPNPPQSLATAMHGAWANFIKTGLPQHHSLPEWPAYDTTRRATMQLDVESRIVDDPNGEERRLWDGVQY